jgi:hypothetical protein
LFASTDVDFSVQGALQDGAKITEWVLYLLQIDGLAREVLEVMHNYLLPVRYKHRDPVVLGVLLEAALSLLYFHFDMLETGEIYFI